MLFFGPNARRMGSQYMGDPAGEDAALRLADFSALAWLARFPQWRLGVRMLPDAPPPPGVAEHRAAALAERKDPDKAVQEARAKVRALPAASRGVCSAECLRHCSARCFLFVAKLAGHKHTSEVVGSPTCSRAATQLGRSVSSQITAAGRLACDSNTSANAEPVSTGSTPCGTHACATLQSRRARYQPSWSCQRPGAPSHTSRMSTAATGPPSTPARARPSWMAPSQPREAVCCRVGMGSVERDMAAWRMFG